MMMNAAGLRMKQGERSLDGRIGLVKVHVKATCYTSTLLGHEGGMWNVGKCYYETDV